MQGEIEHRGIVQKISDNQITVTIINVSACTSCHAKGACSVADMKDKEVEIYQFSGEFRVGQQVVVTGKTAQGFKALFFGYLLPFIFVLTTLILTTSFIGDEGISGLISLGILVPYYAVLYFFRDKLKKSFEFEIKPIQ